jgi:3-methyladenine DNA glycosylase Tag
MSWRVVESKWAGTCEAFRGFDAEAVAAMDETDIDELKQDTRIIRNGRKIEAIIGNARHLIELDGEHGSFQNFLRSHPDFESNARAVKKEFKFLGEFGTSYFL